MGMKLKIFCGISWVVFGCYSIASADSDRDIAVDQAIAGMEEGSRILAPEAYEKETFPEVPGTALSPSADTKAVFSPAAEKNGAGPGLEAQGGNFPGGVISESGPGTSEVESSAGSDHLATSPVVDTGVDVNPGGDQPQEPAAETNEPIINNEPIIDVDAGADLDSGTVNADLGVNPSGNELLDADVTESTTGSETQVDIGSAMDIPIEDNTAVSETETGAPAEEPAAETGEPIIDVDAGADLDSGTVDADLGVNPGGGQLLDADAGGTGTGAEGTVEADIDSAPDLTPQDTTVVTQPVIMNSPSGLSAEIDTTGETVGGETDIGVEADVSGAGAGEDVVDDPTDDGLGGL